MLLNPFYLIRDENRYMYNQIKYATILMQLAYINNKIYNLFYFNLIIYLTKIKEKQQIERPLCYIICLKVNTLVLGTL